VRTYHLYLIEDDIAKAYFGRESMLFDLFSRFASSCSLTEKKTLYKQIQFVTKPLKTLKLNHRVEQTLLSNPHYRREGDFHILQEPNASECGALTINRRCAKVKSTGSFEVETAFFEILRKNEQTFLAMNYAENRYGWLNPIKQERKYV
jgi:hypothetical protein